MAAERRFYAELVEDRLVVWSHEEGRELYRLGFYGKPVGIPKPKGPDFDAPLQLDLMEGLYLMEKGLLEVREGGRPVSRAELARRARRIYRGFELKYMVYRDLREHGLIVQPGIKFGCDFAIYEHGPGIDHAPYLVQVKSESDLVDAIEIVRAGRLATTVRKRFIVAVPNLRTGSVTYLMFKWWRA